jgi:heme/copper-type cytochrome/quinol oxidase subunit 1
MSVSVWFIRLAVIYGLVGMVLGIKMAASDDHTQMPTHAHLMLLGWVSMAIFALVYRFWAELTESRLAKIHFYLYQLGVLGIVIGLYLKMSASSFSGVEGLLAISSILTVISFAIFAYLVWRKVS